MARHPDEILARGGGGRLGQGQDDVFFPVDHLPELIIPASSTV